jgi:molybdate transport system substrate-binding protein
VLLLLLGCGDASTRSELRVFAAASLTDAFTALGDEFTAAHPDVHVTFNFAGSSALRDQILGGAPADVLATANGSTMQAVVDAGAAEPPEPFAANVLEIAVPAGNPGGVTGLTDFAEGDLLLGLCAETVPCGQFGREALDSAGVAPAVDTEEPDVRALLTKIGSGDLDAGIVYRTDVLAAGDDVEGIEIPAGQNVVATYPIAVLTGAADAGAAAEFVAFVRSPAGQRIMASHGFDAAA